MTEVTLGEIKLILFCLVFIGGLGVFTFMYNQSPIQHQVYVGQTSVVPSTTATQISWITDLLNVLPAPFNDPTLLIITAFFVAPISVILGFSGLRILKDLITQWV